MSTENPGWSSTFNIARVLLTRGPPATVQSYDVSTTTVLYGLTPKQQEEFLQVYRERWQTRPEHTLPLNDSDSDEDSIFSIDPDMPALASVSPSTAGSPMQCAPPPLPVVGALPPTPAGEAASLMPTAAPEIPDIVNKDRPAEDAAAPSAPPSVTGEPGAAGFVCASTLPRFRCDGEAVESTWGETAEWAGWGREFSPGARHSFVSSGSAEVHDVRIIGLRGVRDVKSDCDDGLYDVYAYRAAHAFIAVDGNLVIKKTKSLLFPLN
ncbi:hypothetical protein C8R47DRAFT_1230270 [Mycena vitilis]|nr:hypothetical protein C8R47DRAFT_1230270 [Mycena vitilis]